MNLKCLFGAHDGNMVGAETIGSNIIFTYDVCRNCDKVQVTVIGYGRFDMKSWKRPNMAQLDTIHRIKEGNLKNA